MRNASKHLLSLKPVKIVDILQEKWFPKNDSVLPEEKDGKT